jgi:pimeloyl-ACP methyl ester carboxylesterase
MRARFSDDAVTAMNSAVGRAKQHSGASTVNLVGYSGGGAMAALIAERRNDVNCLVTVAAPLDTNAWTDARRVSRLDASLNPADAAASLRTVRQTHFTGGRDQMVPAATSKRFFERVPGADIIGKESYDHRCCWDDEWANLRRLSCLAQ